MTTTKIIDQNIRDLSSEAGSAGDMEMVAICELALNGDPAAINECERVITAAQIESER